MPDFNNMTIVAAAEIIMEMNTQAEFTTLSLQWGVQDHCATGSVQARANGMAELAISQDPEVYTTDGTMGLRRAMIEHALSAPPRLHDQETWKKLIAGLRLDGFDAVQEITEFEATRPWEVRRTQTKYLLRRMLPEDVPELEFREAQSELTHLLDKHQLSTTSGHLSQAIAAFSRGDWAACNAQLRSFLESCLNDIAVKQGCDPNQSSSKKRKYLGETEPPFLLAGYNEWHENSQKPQYVQGLWSRMHPEGSHPGLSEEDDCTFRMQIVLISTRLFLRRFDQRSY